MESTNNQKFIRLTKLLFIYPCSLQLSSGPLSPSSQEGLLSSLSVSLQQEVSRSRSRSRSSLSFSELSGGSQMSSGLATLSHIVLSEDDTLTDWWSEEDTH